MPAQTPPPQQPDFDAAKLYVWVKGLEGKVNNLLREVTILKNDYIKKHNDLKGEIKTMNEDVLELKHQREKTLEKMDLIIKELKSTAAREEVMVLRKYIDLWNPMTFVTQRDLERAIDARLASGGTVVEEKNKK